MRKHRLLRKILRLYPKEFYDHYADEMLQVLDDLLDENRGFYSKTGVWLRTISELPLSILQENNTKIGDFIMKNNLYQKNKKIVVGLMSLFILVSLPLAALWARRNVLPSFAGTFVKDDLERVLDRQYSELGSPLSQFDGPMTENYFRCFLAAHDVLRSQVSCTDTSEKVISLGEPADKETVLSKALEIEGKLKEAGYAAGSNNITFRGQVAGTYDGIDYSPDAFYQKVVEGKYHCIFNSYIAYSNPDTPKIRIILACEKTVNVLGRPSGVMHESNQNYPM